MSWSPASVLRVFDIGRRHPEVRHGKDPMSYPARRFVDCPYESTVRWSLPLAHHMWRKASPDSPEPSKTHMLHALVGQLVARVRTALDGLTNLLHCAPCKTVPPASCDTSLLVPAPRRATCRRRAVAHSSRLPRHSHSLSLYEEPMSCPCSLSFGNMWAILSGPKSRQSIAHAQTVPALKCRILG